MDAVKVALRISRQADAYNTNPFIRGIATILVVSSWSLFQQIINQLHKTGGRLSLTNDYIQQGNVVTRWIPPECPRHLLFGQSSILVLRERTLLLPPDAWVELENTLLRARIACMVDARVEMI